MQKAIAILQKEIDTVDKRASYWYNESISSNLGRKYRKSCGVTYEKYVTRSVALSQAIRLLEKEL